jgi:hypothetical protein
MKKFIDVLKDIEKLAGLKLKSIRLGAEITIEELDWETKSIFLTTAKGKRVSRNFPEMERLWESLCKKHAIHVDSELGGSGSSRNQPETILANLPYVEWFKHLKKKHLTLVSKVSHSLGSLKKMDDIAVEEMVQTLNDLETKSKGGDVSQVVVISGDLISHSEALEQASGVKGQSLQQGVYEFWLPACRLLLVSDQSVTGTISPGTYLVIKGSAPQNVTSKVKIAGKKYIIQTTEGMFLLYLQPD